VRTVAVGTMLVPLVNWSDQGVGLDRVRTSLFHQGQQILIEDLFLPVTERLKRTKRLIQLILAELDRPVLPGAS